MSLAEPLVETMPRVGVLPEGETCNHMGVSRSTKTKREAPCDLEMQLAMLDEILRSDRSHSEPALRWLYRLIRGQAKRNMTFGWCAADVEDVVQDLALDILTPVDTYDSAKGEPKGFFFTLAKFRIRTRLRALSRHRQRHQTGMTLDTLPRAGTGQNVDARLDLEGVMHQLRSCERQVVELLLEGSSPKELAVRAGITSESARQRFRRTRASLRALLGQGEGND